MLTGMAIDFNLIPGMSVESEQCFLELSTPFLMKEPH